MKSILELVLIAAVIKNVFGHGMMVRPIHRGSRWRCDESAPINYNDNELYCGGYTVQWEQHAGKCGLCGDNWADKTPRAHELGGTYGQGKIVKNYQPGSTMDVDILLTANHWGHFEFDLCKVKGEETEGCFEKYKLLTSQGRKWKIPTKEKKLYTVQVLLPKKLECDHCVLRWTYVAGNTWGTCPDGSGAVGCGPQETFRSCSDISILQNPKHTADPGVWNDICMNQKNFIKNILEEFGVHDH